MDSLQATIDSAWETRASLSPANAPAAVRDAVAHVIEELDAGRLRVAEKRGADWLTHRGSRRPCCLSFRLADNVAVGLAGPGVRSASTTRSRPSSRSSTTRCVRRQPAVRVGAAGRRAARCAYSREERRADARRT
jgi:hypothetical protein